MHKQIYATIYAYLIYLSLIKLNSYVNSHSPGVFVS